MRSAAIPAFMLAVVPAAAWAQPRITSAYTTLNLDRCIQLDRGETPEWAEWRCAGYRGSPLFVQNGDERYDVDAGIADKDEIWANTFDYPGKTVEWRISAGRPFAIIYRLLPANPDAPQVSTLVVETIGARGKPGCRVAMIPGSARNANAQARVAADRTLRSRLPCLKPQ
jgi:hypothetical protein